MHDFNQYFNNPWKYLGSMNIRGKRKGRVGSESKIGTHALRLFPFSFLYSSESEGYWGEKKEIVGRNISKQYRNWC